VRRIEQRWRRPFVLIQPPTELRPARTFSLPEFPEIGDDAGPRAAGRAIRLDQGPVGVALAVLAAFQPLEKQRILAADDRATVRLS